MIQGAAVLRGVLNCSARPRVAVYPGFVSLYESHWKAIPAARLALPTVAPSELMVNCPSRGPTWLKPSRSVAAEAVARSMPLKIAESRPPQGSISNMDTIDKNQQTSEAIKAIRGFLVCLSNARVRPAGPRPAFGRPFVAHSSQ